MKKNATIMIVDDNIKNAFAFQQLLEKDDREIKIVHNGREALKMVLNQKIDLIILDVQMPDMNGFQVAQILKTNNRTKNIPVIFASAERKEHESMMKGFEEGGVDYLFKPVDPEIAKAKVTVLLQLHLQKKELVEKNQKLKKYDLLLNNSADIACIINPREMVFEEVNQAMGNIMDKAVNEIQGTSLLNYLVENDRAMIKNLVLDNQKQTFSFITGIFNRKHEKKWLSWNVVSKDGLWFANGRDITTEREAEEIKTYLAIVVKQSQEAIYMYNPDGKIISWNDGAKKIYGFSETEAVQMNIWNVIPDHLMKETEMIIQKLKNGEDVNAYETKRTTKFGAIIDVMFSASVIRDAKNEIKSIAISERDITSQKKAEYEITQLNLELKNNLSKIEQTNKELEAFTYSVSHDLRAPLRHLMGYSELLRKSNDKLDVKDLRYLNLISQSARNMATLIDSLLMLSRTNRAEMKLKDVDMGQLLNESIQQIRAECRDRNIKWTIHELITVKGDPVLLGQVWVNLLSNAVKYTRKKREGRIEIGFEKSKNEYIFYVKDNGAGFDMKIADKLFGVFQRMHSVDEFEGIGIGLANVQRIVIRHGGKVWAEAEVDKGASFYFSLPISGK